MEVRFESQRDAAPYHGHSHCSGQGLPRYRESATTASRSAIRTAHYLNVLHRVWVQWRRDKQMGMGAKGPLTDDGIDRPCQTEAVSCLLSCTRPSLICMHPHEAQISEPVDHVLWSAPNYNPHAPATGHLLDVITNHHRPGLAVASARPRRMASWHAGKLGREQLIDVYISRALSACNLDQPAPRRPGVSGKPREEGARRREFNCSRFVHAAKPIRKALVVVPFLTCTNLCQLPASANTGHVCVH